MQTVQVPVSLCSLNVRVAIPSLTGFRLYLPGTFSISEMNLFIPLLRSQKDLFTS